MVKAAAVNDGVKNRPVITVGVLTYNQEKYIVQCLRNIVEQRGDFKCKIIVLDDCSTDGTEKAAKEYLKNIEKSEVLQIDYVRNKSNLGARENFLKLVKLVEKSGCDYFAFCEGDDYYLSAERLETHLRVHQKFPKTTISFNKLLLYYQDENKYEVFEPDFNDELLTTGELIVDNKIGSLCAAFYNSGVLEHLDYKMFWKMFVGDWMFNIVCSQFGEIRHINIPMSVYRKHSEGIWSGSEMKKCNKILEAEIPKYNKYLDFVYDDDFQKTQNKYRLFLNNENALSAYDVVVIDNIFPQPLSGFSYQEFTNILKSIKNSAVYVTGAYINALGDEPINDLIIEYKRKYPEFGDRVLKLEYDSCFRAKLLYGIFLNTAYENLLSWSDKLRTPFIFTLYPGGGFVLNDAESDKKLKAVFASPWFRKVIVTQQVSYDYLIKSKFCKEEDIEYIFGVVVDEKKTKNKSVKKEYFGVQKDVLDICFVAHKYTEDGRDKGYDVFIEAARALSRKYDDIVFHVVGPWDESVLDITGVGNIVFYGTQTPDWLRDFYKDKDIIISANIDGVLAKGAFDGFPTASVTDAALSGVAMFCTDPLELNQGVFNDGEDIVIIEHSAEDIVEKVEYYYNYPIKLKELSKKGEMKSKLIYSNKNQIVPRIKLLREVIKMEKIREREIKDSVEGQKDRRLEKIRSVVGKMTPNVMKKIYRETRRVIKRIMGT